MNGSFDLFLEGLMLPLRTPPALVLALSTALFIALRAGSIREVVVAAMPIATVGALIGIWLPTPLTADGQVVLALSTSALLCGAAALLPPAVTEGGVVRRTLHGLLVAIAIAVAARVPLVRFLDGELPFVVPAGSVPGVVALVALPALSLALPRLLLGSAAAAIGIRVLASWAGAVSLLLLALQLRPA